MSSDMTGVSKQIYELENARSADDDGEQFARNNDNESGTERYSSVHVAMPLAANKGKRPGEKQGGAANSIVAGKKPVEGSHQASNQRFHGKVPTSKYA